MLLRPNEVVSAGALAEILWGAEPPLTAGAALQNHVMRLRRQLGGCAGGRIRTVPPGYRIDVADDELDLLRFTRLRDSGRAAGLRGAWDQAASELAQALAVFGSGPVLAGVDAPGLHLTEVPRLAEMRLQTLEWRIDAELCLGRHEEIIAELRQTTTWHPFRERFHEQLMLALFRSGRQAEALSAYRSARQCITDELGLEPGRALQDLNQRIIAADPVLYDRAGPLPWAVSAGLAPPRLPGAATASRLAQLPADVADFTGRAGPGDDLAAWITQAQGRPGPVRIAAVTGPGGVGKTALAIHVAHRVSEQFPDGQLHADLRGGDTNPADSSEVLARFLRDMGAERLPAAGGPVADEELQATYRSLLSGRRILIVLDNARDAGQVRPLLPGTEDCAVLVTSRDRLTGLDGARVLELGMMDEADALPLLRRVIGPDRVAAEPQAAREVLRACAGLPLAIRIAASRLASRPSWSLRSFAARLADQRNRLDELRSGDRAVRGSFAVSYAGLPPPAGPDETGAAQAFRVLSTWPGPSLSLESAAAMLGRPPGAAAKPVEELVDAHLIQAIGPGRYRFHDLLRVYARERAAAEDRPEALAKGRDRLLTWYLHTTIAAVYSITPRRSNLPAVPEPGSCSPSPFGSAAAALGWLDSERENLIAATAIAAASGPAAAAWQLPVFLHVYFERRGHFADWITTHEAALDAARQARDRAGQAWILNSLAAALILLDRPADAVTHLRQAASLHREAGQGNGLANSLNSLGVTYSQFGDTGRSVRYLQRALALRHEAGDLHGEAMTLANLAMVHQLAAQLGLALGYAEQAVLVARQAGNGRLYGGTLSNLGDMLRATGRLDEAIDVLGQAVSIEHETGTQLEEAEAFRYLGRAYAERGQADQARDAWVKALSLYGPLNEPRAAGLRSSLESLRADGAFACSPA
jgi:DNA-binding SARP family transcriptional activator/tetratricopeptide (TPR) repeat protein